MLHGDWPASPRANHRRRPHGRRDHHRPEPADGPVQWWIKATILPSRVVAWEDPWDGDPGEIDQYLNTCRLAFPGYGFDKIARPVPAGRR